MAITMRRGNQVDFVPSKMLPGEWAVSNPPDRHIYMCFAAGDVRRVSTYEEMEQAIRNTTEEIAALFTEEVKAAIQSDLDATEAAKTAAQAANTAAQQAKTATAADRVQTGLDRTAAHNDAAQTAADRLQTGSDRTDTAADRVQTGKDASATAADRVQTGLDKTATQADRVQTGLDKTQTGQDKAATAADRAAVEAINSTFPGTVAAAKTEITNLSAAEQADMNAISADIAANYGSINTRIDDLQVHTGYTDDTIVGLQVDYQTGTCTRLGGAIGLTAGADFDKFPMFGDRRRCNLADTGKVNAYYGDAAYTEDGSNGQVMVEQPKFYYKTVPLKLDPITGGQGHHLRKANYYVSSKPLDGFAVHPDFRNEAGQIVDYMYMSACEGSIFDTSASAYLKADEQIADFTADKLSSIANAKPASGNTQNLTRYNAEKLAQNRGKGWHTETAQSISANQLLMMIEYATLNLQSAIGQGVVSAPDTPSTDNNSRVTGGTSGLGNASGTEAGTAGQVSISYRGMENPWGNIWKFVNGVNIWGNGGMKGGVPYICSDFNFAESKNTGNYEPAGFTLANAEGYISAMGYNESYDWLFLPSETLGSSSSPVGDYFYSAPNLNGFRIALLGGGWVHGGNAGGFCLATDGAGYHSRIIGSRLIYTPQYGDADIHPDNTRDITKLQRTTASAITKTAAGSRITLTDAADGMGFKNLDILGKTVGELSVGVLNEESNKYKVTMYMCGNLFDPKVDAISIVRATVVENYGNIMFTPTGNDAYVGDVANVGEKYSTGRGTLIPAAAERQYCINISDSRITSNYITFYDAEKKSLGYIAARNSMCIITTPINTRYMTLRYGSGANIPVGESAQFTIAICEGETAVYNTYTPPQTAVLWLDNPLTSTDKVTCRDGLWGAAYIADTETEMWIPFSDAEQSAMNALCSYNGTTHVWTDDPLQPVITLDYTVDTAQYIRDTSPSYKDVGRFAITGEATGTMAACTDSVEWPVLDMAMDGKLKQMTTTGAQLIPYPYEASDRTFSGLTAKTSNGHIRISGTTTEGCNFYIYTNTLPGMYACKIKGNHTGMDLLVYDRNASTLLAAISGSQSDAISPAFTVAEGHNVRLYFNQASANTAVNIDVDIIMTVADQINSAPYEPYTGAMAAPNPDYPQEVQHSARKTYNLVDLSRFTIVPSANTTAEYDSVSDTLTVSGKWYVRVPFNFVAGKTYYIKFTSEVLQGPKAYVSIYDTALGTISLDISSGNAIFTAPQNPENLVLNFYAGNGTDGKTKYSNVIVSTVDVPYEKPWKKYRADVVISTQNLLDQDTALKSVGFVKQSDGSYYVSKANIPYQKALWTNTAKIQGAITVMASIKHVLYNAYNGVVIEVYCDDGSHQKINTMSTTWTELRITTPEDKTVDRIICTYNTGNAQTWIRDMMITPGAYTGPYTPHQHQSIPIITDRPLTRWDKLTQRDGMWGVAYKGGVYTFTGQEDFHVYGVGELPGFRMVKPDMLPGDYDKDGYCNRFTCLKGTTATAANWIWFGGGRNNVIYFVGTPVSTVEEWQTWLQSNPTTIVYQLATEEWEPLPAISQKALDAAYTYPGLTYAYSTDALQPEITVQYVKDSNAVIQNLITRITALESAQTQTAAAFGYLPASVQAEMIDNETSQLLQEV